MGVRKLMGVGKKIKGWRMTSCGKNLSIDQHNKRKVATRQQKKETGREKEGAVKLMKKGQDGD